MGSKIAIAALGIGVMLVPALVLAEDSDARRSGPVLDYSGKDLDSTLHYYIDDDGRFHFTNRPELVPTRYRAVALTLFVAPATDK